MGNEFNRNNALEFYTPAREFVESGHNSTAIEYTPNKENALPQERITAPPEQGREKGKEKKKQTELLTKVLAATLALSTGVAGTALVAPTTDVRFEEWGATENGVYYSIFIEELAQPLVLVLQNDFTKREVILEEGNNFGEFVDLASNMQYVLSVRYAEGLKTEIAHKKVRTLEEVELEEVKLGFSGVDYAPAENAQGTISVTPHYTDPNGVWTDMYVLLTDEYGVGEGVTPIVESGAPCEIDIAECGFFGSNGDLQIWAYSTETETNELLYERPVSLTKSKTEISDIHFVAAGEDAIARCTVTFADENGYWTALEYGNQLIMEIVALDEGCDYTTWYDIYESGEVCEIMIYRSDYGVNGNIRLNIYAYNDLGEPICVATQTHKAIGGSFVPNSSDSYEEPME